MTFIYDNKIQYADSENLSAFGRLRASEVRLLGEWRYMYGAGTSTEMNDLSVGGGNLQIDQTRNCVLAKVGTASGDRSVRQTKQYNPYIAGTSNLALMTFTFNQGKDNLQQSVGLFDDYNGIFLRLNGTIPEVVIRKSTNYSTYTEQVVTQSDWNIDRLDGSMDEYNQSGYLLDPSKSQILAIDYQWLGVGRVRIGFVIDGKIIYVHNFFHANEVTEVYMTQPSLPCRWEIKNTGTTSSNSELMIICAAVYCEGSDYEAGFTRAISTDGTSISLVANTSSNGVGILAIRLKNSLVGKPNHAIARLKDFSVVTDNDMNYKMVILPGSYALANGANGWTDVPGYSWCQYNKNFQLASNWTANNNFHVLHDGFATGAAGNKSGTVETNTIINRVSQIHQNYDSSDSQILAIIGYYLGTNATVRASINFQEIK